MPQYIICNRHVKTPNCNDLKICQTDSFDTIDLRIHIPGGGALMYWGTGMWGWTEGVYKYEQVLTEGVLKMVTKWTQGALALRPRTLGVLDLTYEQEGCINWPTPHAFRLCTGIFIKGEMFISLICFPISTNSLRYVRNRLMLKPHILNIVYSWLLILWLNWLMC